MTFEEFKQKFSDSNKVKFGSHQCSICGYVCGWLKRDIIYYDSGCYCVRGELQPRDLDDIYRHYRRQTPEVQKELEQKWFEESV